MREGEASYVVSLPPLVSALPAARVDFTRWMTSAAVPAPDIDDLEVVFSELVTNAVRASDPATDVDVRAHRRRVDLVLEVLNAVNEEKSSVHRWDLGDELREGGRGLLIVRAFVDSIETDREDGRVVVRCRRTLTDG